MIERPDRETRPLSSSKPLRQSPPLSPHLSVYRWQPAMIASISHRLTGLVLILFVPLYLWLLHGLTGSADHFAAVTDWLHSGSGKLLLWLVGVSLMYHFCNGTRFLTIDAGWGESREMLRNSARLVLGLTAIVAVVLALLL